MKKIIILYLVFLLITSCILPSIEAAAPTVTTSDATGVEETNATFHGTLTNDGGVSSPWVNLLYDDFNSGWGNYVPGSNGSYADSYRSTSYHYEGAGSMAIRDNDGTNSSFANSSGIDVHTPGYTRLMVDFWWMWRGTGWSAGEDWWIRYYNGTAWATVLVTDYPGTYSKSVWYHFVVYINESNYVFPTKMRLRFQCNGSDDNDVAYIDKIYVNASKNCNVWFQYGVTTSYGANTSEQNGTTGAAFSLNVSGFSPGQIYHYRSVAYNTDGTSTGADKMFVTKPLIPTGISYEIGTMYINTSWTKGTGANNTVICRNEFSYPTDPLVDTIYNNTGTYYNDTGLENDKSYFYTIWSYSHWNPSIYSETINTVVSTVHAWNSSFQINFPVYKNVGEDIHAVGTIQNMTGIPINNIWVYTYITNATGVNVTYSNNRHWVVNGYYEYVFSTSTMTPGTYIIKVNFTQGTDEYSLNKTLYLSSPGGPGHIAAEVFFSIYNTNEGLGLPSETLKIYVNNTRIFQNRYSTYTGKAINVKVKDYYNSTLYDGNFTVNATMQFIDLGLTFHSWKFGNSNNKYYMVSLLKSGAVRWWERGIVPYGEVEFLIPSGTYQMRIYDSAYHELINQSYLIINSRVYVINGTNLTLIINGQSVIIGQLIETIDYLFTPDVRIIRANPPMIFSEYDVNGICLGNGEYLIDPALVVVATTRIETHGNWINSSPRMPTNGSVMNGAVTVLKDELYIAGNASITWVNITYTSNGTTMQNTTYIPSKIDLYGQNITINASEDVTVKRYTKYHQVTQISWLYKSYEGSYSTGINISNPMAIPLYDVYVMLELANTSNPDGTSFVLRDIANNGTIMIYGEDFDVSLGCISFYILSINSSSSRTFTIEYRTAHSEFYSYGIAESRVDGYAPTVFQGGSYQYFLVNWINTGSLIFKGPLMVKLNFSRPLDIDPNSIVIQDQDRNVILSSSGVTQAGDMLMFGSSILGDVSPGGGRAFAVYFLFKEYPGADPLVYKLSTPLIILFGILPVTLFLIGAAVCGIVVTASALLYMMDRKGKRAHSFMVLMAVFSLGIFFLIILQLAGY